METLNKTCSMDLVTLASVQTPLTKITKKGNEIINTKKNKDRSINNQLILFLSFHVNKCSYYLRWKVWSF